MNFKYDINVSGATCVINLISQLIEPHQADDLLLEVESLINKGIIHITLNIAQLTYFNNTAVEIFTEMLNLTRMAGGDCILKGMDERQSSKEVIQKLNAIFDKNVSV